MKTHLLIMINEDTLTQDDEFKLRLNLISRCNASCVIFFFTYEFDMCACISNNFFL